MTEIVSRRAHIELSEQMVVLNAAMQALVSDNAAMRAELDQIRAHASPPQIWLALKAAPRGQFSYQTIRVWAETGLIEAKKEGGRWFVNVASLDARLARLSVA